MLTKLQFRPGINRETTDYTNSGGWVDGNKIRFRFGLPESIGGWEKLTNSPMIGLCVSLHTWTALNNDIYTGAGTTSKYYIIDGGAPYDITPIRRSVTLGANPIQTTAASSGIVRITDPGHAASQGDYVTISGATAFDGLTTGQINKEHVITTIVSGNVYEVDTGGSATAGSVSGGGAAVLAQYQISVGLSTTVVGTGWGAGVWSRGGWGSAATTTVTGAQLRLWSQDNFGEDLVISVYDGGLYRWDTSAGTGFRAVELQNLAGANMTPRIARQVIVSERDRHVIAFGCDPEATPGIQDRLCIRFSDQESITDWESRPDNTAGQLRIGTGSQIVGAVQTKQQILVFTDTSVHAMQFVGPPFTFGISEISSNISIISPNSPTAVGDAVYWMGQRDFYAYDGAVRALPCTVKEYVFDDLNTNQLAKVFGAANAAYSEVWWFYPSSSSNEVDKYVVYNYELDVWYYGTLSRNAWQDRNVLAYPIAAGLDGYVYFHEYGFSNGETNPFSPINSYVQSSSVDISDGNQFMFVTRVIPDLTFRDSSNPSPQVTMTMAAKNYPGGATYGADPETTTRTQSVPVELYTDQLFVRLRGRAITFRVESNQTGTAWRLGTPRIDMRTDGRR